MRIFEILCTFVPAEEHHIFLWNQVITNLKSQISNLKSQTSNPWPYAVGPDVFPEHPADVSLAEAEKPLVGKSRLGAPVAAEAEVVPPRRGRQDL